MKFIKRYRYTIILVLVFVLFLCLGLKVKEILMPDDQKAAYGDRLNEIDDHIIDESLYVKIKSEMTKLDNVDNLSYRVQGKIINFIVTVSDNTKIDDAKKVGEKIITYFEEDDVKYYTFQIYINKKDASLNNFPIIGAKNPLKEQIVWTQDREISKEEEVSNEE